MWPAPCPYTCFSAVRLRRCFVSVSQLACRHPAVPENLWNAEICSITLSESVSVRRSGDARVMFTSVQRTHVRNIVHVALAQRSCMQAARMEVVCVSGS